MEVIFLNVYSKALTKNLQTLNDSNQVINPAQGTWFTISPEQLGID
ncbi:hypothetical protein QUF82_12010 [Thiotrichales bacterium HSG14]|nr:hypothetical protein [Thiotrichales bacterium HSG14]